MNYINTALCYTGSKYKMLNQLLPQMDYTKKYFVDLFAGSGVVGFNVVDKYEKILLNDIINDLIKIHQETIFNSSNFINKVKSLVVNKEDQEGFIKLRENYNQHNTPEGLFALMLCSTNNMIRFNQKFQYNQTFGKRTFSDSTQKKLDEFINYIQPYKDKLLFTSKHFSKIIINKPSMIYIDSPYTNTEAGYNSFWKKDDDIKLYEYCKKIDKDGHSFMVSGILGEHKNGKRWELIDNLVKDYRYEIIENFNYENVARKKNIKNSQEIIIMNYES